MRIITTIILFAIAACTFAQDGQANAETEIKTVEGKVSIASRGADVRPLLFDLFTQSQKNFVLEPNIHFVLFLSLAGVEFDEALEIVCKLSNLSYEVDNGIYFIGKKKTGLVTGVKPSPTTSPAMSAVKKGKLTESELAKRLTTRFTKTVITDVFKSFTEQTGIEIIVEKDVPLYRIDAFLIDTSLQYALDVIMRSTNLKYELTDDKQISISKK